MKAHRINSLIDALVIFKELNPEMNVNMVMAFLEVAKGNGVTGRDLENALDMKPATAARMLRHFDRIQTAGKSGLDMFRVELDQHDYKAKLRYLNGNGEALLARVEAALDGR